MPPTVADRCRSGAPDSPVPLSDRWPDHVSRADSAADRWLGPTVGSPDSPVNFSRTPLNFSRERRVRRGRPTGQSGAPPDRHCSMSGADLLPNLAQPTVATLASVGTPDTVRCTQDSLVPLPTVGASHVSPVDHAADRCEVDRWLTGQSGASPDSPVNFSRTPLNDSRER